MKSGICHRVKTLLRHVVEPQHARIHDQLYRKVYCRMYRRLQPPYRDIRDITGYPGSET
ncbi:MAG: hypothetical protein NTY05_02215 [Rhodocyclales bacterium]|nr:hypothetical protein [Rhodocyclales bacterium]